MSTHTPGPLYESKSGNHQGIVAEEVTGKTIAVVYEKEHTAFIVRACNSYEAMLEALKAIIREADDSDNEKDSDLVEQIDWKGIREAIRLAEGRA